MVPRAVLAFIIWTRLQAARMPPADLVQEAEGDLGQVADKPGQLAEDDLMQVQGDDPLQVAEVDPMHVAEDDSMLEVNDELANLEILLLALCALAAALAADLPSGYHNADRHRGVIHVKPRDQTWW